MGEMRMGKDLGSIGRPGSPGITFFMRLLGQSFSRLRSVGSGA